MYRYTEDQPHSDGCERKDVVVRVHAAAQSPVRYGCCVCMCVCVCVLALYLIGSDAVSRCRPTTNDAKKCWRWCCRRRRASEEEGAPCRSVPDGKACDRSHVVGSDVTGVGVRYRDQVETSAISDEVFGSVCYRAMATELS